MTEQEPSVPFTEYIRVQFKSVHDRLDKLEKGMSERLEMVERAEKENTGFRNKAFGIWVGVGTLAGTVFTIVNFLLSHFIL